MLLTVYDSNRQQKVLLSPEDSSTQVKALQSDNVLTLSFTLYEYVPLDVNDYVNYEGERYWLIERYLPNEKNTQEWKYDVKFYGIESLIKRFLVLNTVDGDPEPVFTLTAPPREHVALIVKAINDGMNNTTDWKVGTVEGADNIVIDYEGKYCNDALKEVAGKVPGAEWWVEGQTVNICRCEHGEEITLAYGRGLTEIERDKADNAKFYTRLFPIGSSRNIDPENTGTAACSFPVVRSTWMSTLTSTVSFTITRKMPSRISTRVVSVRLAVCGADRQTVRTEPLSLSTILKTIP